MKENLPLIKGKAFAIRIVNLYKHLRNEKDEFIMSKQILRSGTSIGANLAEGEYASSKKDFLSKQHIALKEAAETRFWLEILFETKFLSQAEFDSIYQDCVEIIKLLTASTKTLSEQLNKK